MPSLKASLHYFSAANRLPGERYAEGGTPELTSAVRAVLTEGRDGDG